MQNKSGVEAKGVVEAAQECCRAEAPVAPSAMPSSTAELIARYRIGVERFDRRVFELNEEQLDRAFLPDAGVGRWPVRVLLGHIADADLAYSHRFRRAVAEDNPVVNPWDENAFIDAQLYKGMSISGSIYVIHTLRLWTAQWLAALSEEQMQRKMLHAEKGELTVQQVLVYATWHLEHHAEFLRKKIEKMLGPATKVGGGCGAGCGCAKA